MVVCSSRSSCLLLVLSWFFFVMFSSFGFILAKVEFGIIFVSFRPRASSSVDIEGVKLFNFFYYLRTSVYVQSISNLSPVIFQRGCCLLYLKNEFDAAAVF